MGSRGEKIFKKGCGRAKNLKNWGARGAGRWHEGTLYMRAPCIGCAGRFLGLGARPLAALLEVRFVQAPHSATGTRSERLEIRSSYIERAHLQAPSLAL